MADYTARVAPFIKVTFYVTSQAGKYPDGSYHSGLDISTGTGTRGANLYSICNGTVIQKAYDGDGYGNYVIIKDNESNYAFLFGHMADPSTKNIGDSIKIGEQFGVEGATGNVTGLHTHVEMEDYVKNGNKWIYDANNPAAWGVVYFSPTDYMGFPNQLRISVYYDGTPVPPTPPSPPSPHMTWSSKFNWAVYLRKLRNKRSNME